MTSVVETASLNNMRINNKNRQKNDALLVLHRRVELRTIIYSRLRRIGRRPTRHSGGWEARRVASRRDGSLQMTCPAL
jgi:hypothetical protein